jgi:hypothetical protein
VLGLVALCLLCRPCAGQELPPLEPLEPVAVEDEERAATVTDRRRLELEPLGVRVGGFLLYPKLELEERYNDNVFADETNTKSDFISVASPSLRLDSNWSSHELNLFARASIGRYLHQDSEAFNDFSLGGDGRLDISRDSSWSGALSYASLHEERGSPDDVEGIEPTTYALGSANTLYARRFNRVVLSAEGAGERYDYNDVATSVGEVNNDDRDRIQARVSLRADYELDPGYGAFVRATGNGRFYDDAVDDNGFDRDSKGWEAVVGARLGLTGITTGEVFVGYADQDYEDPHLDTIGGAIIGAALTWNVTPLTTVTGTLARTIEETTLVGASGFFANGAYLRADHELLRNLLLNARASYVINKYEGIEREDVIYQAGAGAKYLLTRNFYLTVDYTYTQRDSAAPGLADDYRRNVVLVRLETQL